MRLAIECHETKAQMEPGAPIDLSRPIGHVVFMKAVVYDDDGVELTDAIEACRWFRNGKAVDPDPALGDCPAWEFRVDACKGTERPGDDLYRARVTLKED